MFPGICIAGKGTGPSDGAITGFGAIVGKRGKRGFKIIWPSEVITTPGATLIFFDECTPGFDNGGIFVGHGGWLASSEIEVHDMFANDVVAVGEFSVGLGEPVTVPAEAEVTSEVLSVVPDEESVGEEGVVAAAVTEG